MGRLKYEEVKNIIESAGWSLITETYQNLDQELELRCPENHRVFTSLKKFRNAPYCPNCSTNSFKVTDDKIIAKKKGIKRVLALDQSTQVSGWSVYDDRQLIKYGIFYTSLENQELRDHALKEWLVNMIHNWKPDLIAIEDIQLQEFREGKKVDSDNIKGILVFKTLARLQGVIIECCIEQGIDYTVCSTNTWRAHCKVKGSTRSDKKRSMQLLVKEWHDVTVTEDEADAIGIGYYASEVYGKQNTIVNWEE